MSYKWWYGLSPEGIQNTLNREIQIRDDRIEELEKENFILAATQCPFPDGEGLTGSPSGYSYCAKDVELEGCPFYWGSGSHNDWWQERRATVAALEGEWQ